MPSPSDAWHWRAVYQDGDSLGEHDSGVVHGWREVDSSRLAYVILEPQAPGLQTHVLRISPDSRPIVFRRRVVVAPVDGSPQYHEDSLTVLGWQRTVKGVSVKSFCVFHPDGSVLVTDDDGAF